MKVKITTGKGFRGATNYANKDGAEFIASSTGKDPKTFLRECAKLRESRPDCRVPVVHFSLSAGEGEHLTQEEWQTTISKFKEKMGLQEHDFYCTRHTDTDHDHVHIIVSKINPTGKLWDTDKSALRGMKACTEIEQEMGMKHTKTLNEFRAESGKRRQPVKDNELQLVVRTGSAGSRRKSAIQAKFAKQKEIGNYEKGRAFEQNGAASRDGTGQPGSNRQPVQSNEQATFGTKKARISVGAIKSWRRGDLVHFSKDGERLAVMSDEKIELFTTDQDALDFAIKMAVRSGKIPLDAYGTPEFIKAVEARAMALNVPMKSEATDKKLKEIQQRIEAKEKTEQEARRHAQQQQPQPPRPPIAAKQRWSPKP